MKSRSLFCMTIVFLNILGILLGFAMKSNPEVHLIGALSSGLIALLSGLVPVPERLAWLVTIFSQWNPLTRLLNYLLELEQNTGINRESSILVPVIVLFMFTVLILWRSIDWDVVSENKKEVSTGS